MTQCNELRNIEYQTMLLNNKHTDKDKGVLNIQQDNVTKNNIDNILEMEQTTTITQKPWNKLEKMYKIQKLNEYAEIFGEKEGLTLDKIEELKDYLLNSLNRKRFQRVKEISYDKEKSVIKSIIGLQINSEKKFTLKQTDHKKTSTLKNLPKRRKVTKDMLKSKLTGDNSKLA